MLDDEVEALGFILLDHGLKLKGKQRWLIRDEDLTDMYLLYRGQCEVTLGTTVV